MLKISNLKAAVLAVAVLGVAVITQGGQVSADAPTNQAGVIPIGQQITPLEIEPVCSDAVAGQTHWKVTNKNAQAVALHWTNLYNNVAGDSTEVNGVSELITSFDFSDANNTTRFMSGSDTNQTNATRTPCTTPVQPPAPVACLDGHDQHNLNVVYLNHNTVQITTKNNQPLCADQDIYFSSYIMPANYNGAGFENNPTASPQSLFNSTHVVLPANSLINQVVTVNLPDSCNNIQVDVYYAPEITTVGPGGHGTANILSQVYASTGACTPTNGGGMGGGTTPSTGPTTPTTPVVTPTAPTTGGMGGSDTITTPVVATTPAVKALQQPAVLPNTGSNLLFVAAIVPLLVAVASFQFAESYQKRRLV